jgi:hypothetical protein
MKLLLLVLRPIIILIRLLIVSLVVMIVAAGLMNCPLLGNQVLLILSFLYQVRGECLK